MEESGHKGCRTTRKKVELKEQSRAEQEAVPDHGGTVHAELDR